MASSNLSSVGFGYLRIAVVGCSHGELDAIYAAAHAAGSASSDSRPVDLVICCGDFQAVRNGGDLACMACPPKYRAMHSFWQLYSGLATAPIPTLFIGGNHEASNHSSELPWGGWAARRVWFMGSAGVIHFGGLRIGGVSGIYKSTDFKSGYYEKAPYAGSTETHSAGHQRAFDFWRLGALAGAPPGPLDIFISHDWPEGVYRYGDTESLVRNKPFFRADILRGALGSPPSAALLACLKPRFWFAGHLHTKFAALVPHADGSSTRFLALDKPVPGRAFLQVLDVPRSSAAPDASFGPLTFGYDPLWMTVAVKAHAATPTMRRAPPLPSTLPLPTVREISQVAAALAANSARSRGADAGAVKAAAQNAAAAPLAPIAVPDNFTVCAPLHDPQYNGSGVGAPLPLQQGNPQMDQLLGVLGLPHIITVPWGGGGGDVCVGGGASLIAQSMLSMPMPVRPDSGVAAAELRALHSAAAAAFAAVAAWGPGTGTTSAAAAEVAVAVAVTSLDANEINLNDI